MSIKSRSCIDKLQKMQKKAVMVKTKSKTKRSNNPFVKVVALVAA